MKRTILAFFLIAVTMSFNSCLYSEFDTTVPASPENQNSNSLQVFSDESVTYMDDSFGTTEESSISLPNNLNKSAEVKPTIYNLRMSHASDGKNSVLTIALRNKEKVNGQTGNYRMAMFAIGLPNHVTEDDIKSMRYARKKYVKSDNPLIGLIWKKMAVPKFKIVKELDEYTDEKVLKIEKGIDEDDWLIVEITFNKAYDTEQKSFKPYYFKAADKWFRSFSYVGINYPAQQVQSQNNME